MSSQWESQKLLQGLVSHELTAYLSIFNLFNLSTLRWYYQKHVNQIILNCKLSKAELYEYSRPSFEFCWLWIFPWIKLSRHLALCEINLDDSINSGNFSVRGYLPLIRKDSVTHMHGLAFSVKEGLLFARDLFRENSADSFLCFRLALLHLVSYFFFFIDHLLLLCARFLILFRLT